MRMILRLKAWLEGEEEGEEDKDKDRVVGINFWV
jgi:hypothetical protein